MDINEVLTSKRGPLKNILVFIGNLHLKNVLKNKVEEVQKSNEKED
ncbi:hypothetical protein Bmyc01_42150 [Bacillus mycoides]|nr:hypothetical protein BTJ45_01319 [Bacillus mycoides]GCF77607.1 hypothetical protein BC2926_51480 [Bacillus cereus]GLV65546.1 hypothetical protein Bmyc01_42150 [Bacillus mycoides]